MAAGKRHPEEEPTETGDDVEMDATHPDFIDLEVAAVVDEIAEDISQGEDPDRPIRVWLRKLRARMDRSVYSRFAYRAFIMLIGGAIVLAGIVMLVTPGPGWLAIFLGLAILGTEFHWAKRLSDYAKHQLTKFWLWWKDRRETKKWKRARKVAEKRARKQSDSS